MAQQERQYEPRRAAPGAVYGYTAADGSQKEIKADDDGVLTPRDATEVSVLDSFDLPVARKAMAEAAAEETKTGKPAAKAKESD